MNLIIIIREVLLKVDLNKTLKEIRYEKKDYINKNTFFVTSKG